MLAPPDTKNKDTESAAGDAGKTDKTQDTENAGVKAAGATDSEGSKVKVVYKLCDLMKSMIAAWKKHFEQYIPDRVQVYSGDIFKAGPAADAIVSPANSFGFMDGGIDMAYSRHFGWQMQDRLQEVIREKYRGELLVGDAIIIPTVEGKENENCVDWAKYNEGQPIKYLISAPTMRVPIDVSNTVNAYLAFRAVILAVEKHNNTPGNEPIKSVLCPGLGTAVGRMPAERCAYQMLYAFETFELGLHTDILCPGDLGEPWGGHMKLSEYGENERDRLQKLTDKFEQKSSKTVCTDREKEKEDENKK